MKCVDCGKTIHADESEQVMEDFYDQEDGRCWGCSHRRFQEDQINQTMLGPPQDEGDDGSSP